MTMAQCAENWLEEKILVGECKEQTFDRNRRIIYERLLPEIGEEKIWSDGSACAEKLCIATVAYLYGRGVD